MTHFFILLAAQRWERQCLKGFADGALLIPRYLWNGWPGHNTHLVYRHASLLYYITFLVFAALEVLILGFILGTYRGRVIARNYYP